MDTAFRKWYEKNKIDFNAKRRIRYRTDLEYKNKVLMAVRKNRKAKAPNVNPDIISVSNAMKRINRTPQTARFWEERGYIPVQKNKSGHRFYTRHQVKLMGRLAEVLNDFRYNKTDEKEVQVVVNLIKENWDANTSD